jgi:predicted DCC family thiol-disulfide oxidoreductase YuxK
VHRVARLDRAGRLRFAPLQGETARRLLPAALTQSLATAVLLEARDGVAALALRSAAILRVWELLPPPWRWLALLRAVPRPLRDGVYDWVAARRQRLSLGPLEWPLEWHSALTPEQRARFLP